MMSRKTTQKALALLEDCVALGDTEAMLMLAKCCALGHGTGQNAERAESLISDAGKKRNPEALSLMRLIKGWKGRESINLGSLSGSHRKRLSKKFILTFVTGQIKGELTIERVCLLMNIVPCQEFDLTGQSPRHIIEHTV